jgi:hypothetical protein
MRGVLKTSAQAPIAPEKWQHIVETSDFTFAAAAGPGATPASESSEETLGTQPRSKQKPNPSSSMAADDERCHLQ